MNDERHHRQTTGGFDRVLRLTSAPRFLIQRQLWQRIGQAAALALWWLASSASLAAGGALDPARGLTQYKNERWQSEQGLPQNTVQALAQTRDGYLWIGTMDGLARFDGVRFTVFDSHMIPELGSGSILGLMEDADGNLWIARTGAAILYRNGRFQTAFAEETTAGAAVWSFCQGQDGVVWAATDHGLVRWEKGRTRVYSKADGLPVEKLRSITFDREGVLWIGTTGGGLVSFAHGRFETFSSAHGFPNDQVRAVCADPQGGVWAATAGGGLAHVQHGMIKTFTTSDGLPTNQLSALALDPLGTLWIGTWGSGLCRMREGRFSHLTSAEGLSGDQIWSLLADREGSLWIGTWVGGLNRLRNRHFAVLGTPEGLSHDNARAVLHARDGTIWVATAGGGVNRIQGGRVTTIRKKDGLPSDETSSLCEGQDGSLWIGTYTSGVARLKNGRIFSYGKSEGLPSLDVRALYQDRGGTLWAGTSTGLARFDGRGFVSVTALGEPIEGIVTILEDRGGTLWFGTLRKGLFRLRDGAFRNLTKKDGLAADKILALHEDDRGSLWIGTGGAGINRLRKDRIMSIKPTDGLWDGFVQTILEDGAGNFWMTCNRGVFRTPRAELEAFAEGRLMRVTSVGYGPADALRSITFAGGQVPSGTVDSQGRLWFPTFKGLVVVDPFNLPAPGPPPAVRIEEVTANGVEQPSGAPILLPPGPASLSIRYTAMTLLDPDQVRFRYRMDGLPGGWVDAGSRREAFFPSLPHGNFHFRVCASVDGKSWREMPTSLALTIQPFFYQTPWFLGLAFIGILAAGGIVHQLQTVQLRHRQAEMERLIQKRTEELRQANEHLSQLSFLDALTGLANRRRFDEALDEEWRRAQRFKSSIALVMADVDAFKAYNDTLGHPAGDRCLKAVANVFLNSVSRAGDLAARYGGEEFVVLVPGADHATALAFAEMLRQACESLAIPHPASPAGPNVTISLGVAACHPSDELPMGWLVSEADAALYRAKQAGRNRVV
ncbi:MAG: diguanylate cyclase [Acidobacteriota bacterium]|nr:diguanylate cyclase [Acidobacteriota bacterium]